MLVVLALAAVAVIASVTVVAMGRGGELSEFAPDVPPLDLPKGGQLGAVDFMALQLPVSLVGYHTQSVDEALNRVAGALSERDTRIAVLEQRVAELLAGRLQARHELKGGLSATLRELEAPYELSGHGRPVAGKERSGGSSAVSLTEREAPHRLFDAADPVPDPVPDEGDSGGSPAVPRAEQGPEGADGLPEADESSVAERVSSPPEPSRVPDSPPASPTASGASSEPSSDAVGVHPGELPGTDKKEESR
ncbi:hypothetical protein [Streptosporangium amethystogenes]|uniref:hypothetical protein n=1 Tax=Streptosporangium amethystogenes TaxID=2002 RepID=UPI000690E4A1|nr:hypothetical protein [Streptosporangium amethystogenes]